MQSTDDSEVDHDVLIIGGGPAGMSAALVAGRASLQAAVVNAEAPRNAVTTASHGFLTRDGAHPMELLEIAKDQLQKYDTVRYIEGKAIEARESGSGFEVELEDGTRLTTNRIVVATGRRNELEQLGLPGIEDVYGNSVYPCPFCDGYEHRNEALAVFGGKGVSEFVPLIRNWSSDIVVFTNGTKLDPSTVSAMNERDVQVVEEEVSQLVSTDGNLQAVELDTGDRVQRESGFVFDDCSVPSSDLPKKLGVETTMNWGMEVYDADEPGRTDVPGVYVVGDARTGFSGLMNAASEGSECVEHIVHEIAQERWQV
ncbi:thioredoxin-disulfide reductase [Haloferax elongans ATCC BAA-1513]|uniref:Thioredoxin-disulfide reductase n=2 Tax=Haloferax elongans TaxID=403191 RepID=M0HJB3_HALEO|nr:thioredoxin-disulfide reductase [Haloferax elongans ATCC BAA-1513]